MLGKEHLPEHYVVQEEPRYDGDGEHSVASLETLVEDYKQYAHQQRIIKHAMQVELENITTLLLNLSKSGNLH
tara:strand:+ start:2705 stop:2923 length:219 start_codon:yes stop_codon:yes gene_type:complete